MLLFFEHQDNVLLMLPDAAIASALVKVQWGVLAVASSAVVLVVAKRRRSPWAPRRRALLPSVAGSLSGVLYSAWLTSLVIGSPWCLSSGP